MLFDASDYTRLIARKGRALDAKRQAGMDNKYPKGPRFLSPSQVLSAALSIQSCNYRETPGAPKWCNLPTILPKVISQGGVSTIPAPTY